MENDFSNRMIQKIVYKKFISVFMYEFIYSLEKTLSNYLKKKPLILFNYFLYSKEKYPSILSAKMIADYIIYKIEFYLKIPKIFFEIRKWQFFNYDKKRLLEDRYFIKSLGSNYFDYLEHFSFKRFPILGIRIECSGTPKKGKRKQKIFYGDWVTDYELNSKASNNMISSDIDYYQSIAILFSGTVGIKVWVFFKTHLYDENLKYKGIISY